MTPLRLTPRSTGLMLLFAASVAPVGALAVTGSIALLSLAWRRYNLPLPFPRGSQSRSDSSPPFATADGRAPRAEVVNQFYAVPSEDVKFIQLSQGKVRYMLRGPQASNGNGNGSPGAAAAGESDVDPGQQGHSLASASSSSLGLLADKRPVVVLVHGFSIAADIWKQQTDHLVAAGYTVLSFDNYGRGWSDAPDNVSYDARLYVGQIAELLCALNICGPIDLIGVSMGGAIVTEFAAKYPQRVRKLGLVCPAGLPMPIAGSSPFAASLAWPIIGPLLFKRMLPSMQARGAAAQWEGDASTPAYESWGAFAAQNVREHPGFVRTLHRTVVEFPMFTQSANYARLVAQGIPARTLIIWGEHDGLTPYANAAKLQALLPGSQLVTVVNAKHNMLIERAQPISETIQAWLEGKQLPARVNRSVNEGLEGQ